MTPESVVAKVFGLARHTVSDATSNTSVDAWDSLNHVTLVMELEATYGVSFSPEETLEMTDVAAIKRALHGHGVAFDGG